MFAPMCQYCYRSVIHTVQRIKKPFHFKIVYFMNFFCNIC